MSGVEEVKEKVVEGVKAAEIPTVEDRVGVLEESVDSLKAEIDVLARAEVGAELSKEDRATVVLAFKSVHSSLGNAFGVLAEKDLGYKVVFDSKRGVLSVRLFKLV